MTMTDERWRFLMEYPHRVFGPNDPQLDTLMERAVEAGLPPIAISHGAGQLLKLLVALTPGRVAIELGTLGGFSGIWIARGLQPGGKLISVEYEPVHAEFAKAEFLRAGVSDRVEIVLGAALDVLPRILSELGSTSVDFVFIDAVKSEYSAYFDLLEPHLSPGAIVTADNVYGTGRGWIDEGFGTDDFNRGIAAKENFEATSVPVGGGLLIARRVS